jgi:hypothetical protein
MNPIASVSGLLVSASPTVFPTNSNSSHIHSSTSQPSATDVRSPVQGTLSSQNFEHSNFTTKTGFLGSPSTTDTAITHEASRSASSEASSVEASTIMPNGTQPPTMMQTVTVIESGNAGCKEPKNKLNYN